jgi:Spy/CpxP family protein refolding chaperone
MTNTTRSRMIAALMLALAAGAGFATGLATDRVLLARGAEAAPAATDPPPGEGIRILLRGPDTLPEGGQRRIRMMLPAQMGEDLELTPEQQRAIERIVGEEHAAFRELTDQFQPALRAVIERSRERIEEVLTEEQVARWHAAPAAQLRRPQAPPTN